MEPVVSRRAFVTALLATYAVGRARASSAATPAPKETGSSSEGLLAGRPGFQPRSVAPLAYKELPGFLSAAQLEAHHAEYQAAIEQLRSSDQTLAAIARVPANSAAYAELRRRQVALANEVLLHELYFTNVTAKPGAVSLYVRRQMDEHMGSMESWADDFKMCALSARAWAVLIYDPYDDRWHNTVMDSDNDGVWIGANPLVVCDVAPHAYSRDYTEREAYVTKFVEHIDWEEVGARYRRVDRM